MNVQAENLTHVFGRKRVIDGINIEVGTGVFGLLGPNGAGKTTLLRILATALKPDIGELRLLGHDPRDSGQRRVARRSMGYLPQTFGYYHNFTVSEFVEYLALLKEVPPAEIMVAVRQAVHLLGLEAQARSKLKTLSGGMLRRVGIAQAVVNRPSLLLLDEPTAGLDPEQRVSFRQVIRNLGQTGTVIVSTHLVEDVAAACTDVAVMSDGHIVFRGTPSDLAAFGETSEAEGDTVLERAYTSVLIRSGQGGGRSGAARI